MKFSRLQWLIFFIVDFLSRIPTHVSDGYDLNFLLGFNRFLWTSLIALTLSILHIVSLFIAQRLTVRLQLPRLVSFAATVVVAEIILVAAFYSFLILPDILRCPSGDRWCITPRQWRNLAAGGAFAAATNSLSIPIAASAGYMENRIRQYRGTLYAKLALRFVLVQIVAFAGVISVWVTFLADAFLSAPRHCLSGLSSSLSEIWISVAKFLFLVASNPPLALISICVGYFAVRGESSIHRAGAKKRILKFAFVFGLTEATAFAACLCFWITHVAWRFLYGLHCDWAGMPPDRMQSVLGEAIVLLASNLVPVLIFLESIQKSQAKTAAGS